MLILVLFPLAVLALTASVCAVFFVATGTRAAPSSVARLTADAFPWVTGAVFIWIFFSYNMGDDIILGSAKARRISVEDDRRLFKRVQNVAIMAGLPTPKVYMIDDESLNAFATGRTPETASIALTTGIVAKLKPNELEAVIAHEMGHIGNRDTRLMIIVVTGIAMFTFLAEITFRAAISGRISSKKDRGEWRLVLLASALILWIFGVFVAPLIRMALSRNREFLADATSARLTHNPDALADALEAIAIDPRVEVLDSRPLMGALCVANPLKRGSLTSAIYASHPPIEDRVDRLRKMARGL